MSIFICRESLVTNELFTEMFTIFRYCKIDALCLCVPVKQVIFLKMGRWVQRRLLGHSTRKGLFGERTQCEHYVVSKPCFHSLEKWRHHELSECWRAPSWGFSVCSGCFFKEKISSLVRINYDWLHHCSSINHRSHFSSVLSCACGGCSWGWPVLQTWLHSEHLRGMSYFH